MVPFIVIGAIVLLIVIIFIGMHNSLVNKRNQVENAFSSIDVMLKKRYDLIPNLVNSCKEYMKHEESLLTKVTELRTKAMESEGNPEARIGYENELGGALKSLNVAVENYPDLKANENFIQLQRTLNVSEEQISAARRTYNATVTDFNNAVEMFPSSIVAGMMKLKRKKVFEVAVQERENVDVGDLFNLSSTTIK